MISALLSMAMFIGMLASTNPVTVAAATDKNSQNKNSYDFSKVKSGDVITFGSYEQDNNLDNGTEPIEWIVLSVENDRAFLVSKYGLDCIQYDDNEDLGAQWDYDNFLSWEKCRIKNWLNDDFYNTAFNTTEQKLVIETNFSEEGFWTNKRKVSLLSLEDIRTLEYGFSQNLYECDIARRCTPTEYAKARGVKLFEADEDEEEEYLTKDGEPSCSWWLRYPGYSGRYTYAISFDGSFKDRYYDVTDNSIAVRPAIYIYICPNLNLYADFDLSSAKTGDELLFGYYEQDNNIENGAEYIEWILLSKEDDRALLLSKYGLDNKAYDDLDDVGKRFPGEEGDNAYIDKDGELKYYKSELINVTWEDSTLRSWMNNDFYNEVFDDSQKNKIIETLLVNSDNPNPDYGTSGGNDTYDKVFLLTSEDVTNEAYGFNEDPAELDIARRCLPTTYAAEKGVGMEWMTSGMGGPYPEDMSDYPEGGFICNWWLRSPGTDAAHKESVRFYGRIFENEVCSVTIAVRPAIYIDISDNIGTGLSEEEKKTDFENIKVGDLVYFGSYEQDNDLENGTEPIEWIVLSTNKGKAFLLSKYILDHRFYDENDYYDDYLKERFPDGEGGIDWDSVNIPWEECTLSVWLNTDFYNFAFNKTEKELMADVEYEDNQYTISGENADPDKVFLLSEKDITNPAYGFSTDTNALDVTRRCSPTAYAIAQGAETLEQMAEYIDVDWKDPVYLTGEGKPAGWWWLRSPGYLLEDGPKMVWYTGAVGCSNYADGSCYGIRPAIYVSLDDSTSDNIVHIGDVNGDGEINAKDVTQLRRYLAGGWNAEIHEENSDVNGDDEVNAKDVTMLRRFLAGGWGVTL